MTVKINPKYFINRELSWLDFNSRVLEEAIDTTVPILDRLKFTSIFSNNLDEFFMVRVATLRRMLNPKDHTIDPSGLSPREQLKRIRKKTCLLIKKQYDNFITSIMPELERNSIFITKPNQLQPEDKKEAAKFFIEEILPVLTPVAVDPSHPFPLLNNCSIEIAVLLKNSSSDNLKAFIEVPKVLPRFIKVPSNNNPDASCYLLLEDIILDNISMLFAKCEIINAFPFRITRDMDLTIDEDGISDLISHIEKKLKGRKRREPIRLEIPEDADQSLKKWLINKLRLSAESIYTIKGPMDLAGFFELVEKENRPELLEPKWQSFVSPKISDKEPVFESIKKEGYISLFHPYEQFDPVIRFLEEASEDPNVLAIKQTLYRVSGDSPIVKALQKAAENGKQVTVIVELKARFDEEKNITWAKKLEESGAHVIYGIAGLKIHCKALLVIRKEDGAIRRYLHLSTGNYNDKTAKIYTDIGMFTDDPDLCGDLSSLFNVITGYSEHHEWNKISVSPFNLRQTFIQLIDREARLSSHQNQGHIIAKMNSLVDPEIISRLYNAAYAGVKIDLIVRGICCLRPGIDTENIRVISIVDRFLEHSRIFYFANGGMPEYYISSADWMPRNLDRRIELMFPVEDKQIRRNIDQILKIQINDKIKGRFLKNSSGKYKYQSIPNVYNTRSQTKTYELFKNMSIANHIKEPKIKVFNNQ